MQSIREWHNVSVDTFQNEIREAGEPAILRQVAVHWPIVAASSQGPQQTVDYLASFAADEPFEFALAPPESRGLLHYQDDLNAFTYAKHHTSFQIIVEALLQQIGRQHAATIAIQSLYVDRYFPGLSAQLPFDLVPSSIEPRIWIGNRAKVATHNDPLENIACVAAGRRRFTLFPPEQIGNLYMGPLHVTPAGTPISMVHLTAPDFDRYPRFRDALQHATVADLEPGDAVYIPYQWFHHVEALDDINILLNYWWNEASETKSSPWDAMLHAIMAIRQLPPQQRRAWRANFDHYVFLENGDPGEHLPDFARGILKRAKPTDIDSMRAQLVKALSDRSQ